MHLLVPDAIRRGRFKESYSFLVMLFFLYHLSENHDFSVDFAHPIDSRLAAFLQSTGSVECLVKGGKLRGTQSYAAPTHAQACSNPHTGLDTEEGGYTPGKRQGPLSHSTSRGCQGFGTQTHTGTPRSGLQCLLEWAYALAFATASPERRCKE